MEILLIIGAILATSFAFAFGAFNTGNSAKTAFDDATFMYQGQNIGIIDVELGEEASEIDTSDTNSPPGESEFLAGKISRTLSFTAFHKVGQEQFATRVSGDFSLQVEDEDGNTTTWTGKCLLLSKSTTGSRDGAIQVAYSGRIIGAITEEHES